MKCCLLSALLLISCSLGSSRALAFVDEPYITPAHPTPSTPISVHVSMGWCHASVEDFDEATLTVVAPGQLQLVTDGVALPPDHPFCIHPPFTYRFDIGTLPAGTYTLQFFIRDDFAAPEPIGFGSTSFVVATTTKIPTTSYATLLALSTILLSFGALATTLSYRE